MPGLPTHLVQELNVGTICNCVFIGAEDTDKKINIRITIGE